MRRRCVLAAACIALISLIGSVPAAAQSVVVAPQMVVLDARSRTASVVLVNQEATPAEVTLSFFYGYPETDAEGTMRLRTFEVVLDSMPSSAEWIRSYPDRLVLKPYERRAVRLFANPPADLASREYWTRLMVAVRGRRLPVAGVAGVGISVGLDLEVRSILGVFYRPADLSTGVALDDVRTALEQDTLVVRARLTRQGNAAFVGSLLATLRDERQQIVSTTTLPLGVYYSLEPRMLLPVGTLAPGNYELTLEAVSTRPDLSPQSLLPALPARAILSVRM